MMKNIAENLWRWICYKNYKYKLFTFKKEIYGRIFYMYDPPLPKKYYEDKLLEILLCNVKSGDHVYDAGAARGLYTLCLAMSGCSVYSFEPNPITYSFLLKNIHLNKLSNVLCFNFGLSDSVDILTFYLADPALGSSFSSDIIESNSAKVIGTDRVEVKKIDTLVSEGVIPLPDHIKIDVEGFGLNVLKGAEKTISQKRPMIYFEPHYGKEGLERKKRLYDFFQSIDYEIKEYGKAWICLPN